jgi:hypothetical protein
MGRSHGGPTARRVVRLCTVSLAFVLALVTGCDAAPAPPAVPPAPTRTPQEQAFDWTETVCGALAPVIGYLTAAPSLDLNAREATRQAYLTYLTEGIARTDQARATLAAAGPAPVPDGDVIADLVRGQAAELRTNLVDARALVEGTDTTSAIALGRAAVGVSKVVNALLNGAEVARTLARDPTLHAAYEQAPACIRLRNPDAPTPQPPAVSLAPSPPTR